MKILLDTHIWLWYLQGNEKLSEKLQYAIGDENNDLWLSPISIWETIMLVEKNRINIDGDVEKWINSALQTLQVIEAKLNHNIAILSRKIQLPHHDPADRFIGATAIYYGLILATVDRNLISCPEIKTIS
ncbi:type II toxin-antitoxin system VapC family toxin [Cyanobacterium sp. IPPAS B-1200]|uniref:type II toxin-antitoxin system VapC family toxin n=1 Tax=Cyanobacterium sp. IPPAS B-1200 TaxID=1562720 RepID=UPI0008526049|nr:type II toxin-antitoxin system VapC family toxin [Cyanobacterium sp. IPPAS B-1200]OEJ79578.1 twitching motility protein PilT [Cyanobacterium sp. IPPAS B-1200]